MEYKLCEVNKDVLYNLYNIEKLSMNDISKLYNCTSTYIGRLFKRFEITSRTYSEAASRELNKQVGVSKESQRKYSVNEDFFNCPDSSDKYWVLGFFSADGCIENHKMISFSQKEPEILEKIKHLLKYTGPIHKKKNKGFAQGNDIFVLRIHSIKIVSCLKEIYGFTERKSLTVRLPEIPDIYLGDFIRGLFDGDGSITIKEGKRKGNRGSSFSILGSVDLIQTLHKKLLDKEIYTTIDSYHINTPKLITHKQETYLSLYNLMYTNSSERNRLNRKYDKFTQLITNICNKKQYLSAEVVAS